MLFSPAEILLGGLLIDDSCSAAGPPRSTVFVDPPAADSLLSSRQEPQYSNDRPHRTPNARWNRSNMIGLSSKLMFDVQEAKIPDFREDADAGKNAISRTKIPCSRNVQNGCVDATKS